MAGTPPQILGDSLPMPIDGRPNTTSVRLSRQAGVDACYKMGRVSSLVQLHDEIDLDNIPDHEEDKGGASGDYIKAFVFGGLDGIISTFALVASMGGAKIKIESMIAIGLAKVIADAMSMGFGEFMSASAELETTLKVKEREEWEMENCHEGEVKEMCEIYMKRGCSKEDALTMMTLLAKHKDLFVEHMMVMEHGLLPPDDSDKWAPVKQGFVCFLAFTVCGLVPLAAFFVLYAVGGSIDELWQTLLVAYALTATMLFAMGFVKAHLTGSSSRVKSGACMLINGSLAGGAAYLLGDWLGEML